MAELDSNAEGYWVRTVGAPRLGDPRDGELHQFLGPLRPAFYLEPADDDPSGEDARYVLDPATAPVEEDGRVVWTFTYEPSQAGDR